MSNQQAYRNWAEGKDLPLFHQPAWLDVVAGLWDAALVIKGDKPVAAMPYCLKKGIKGTRIYMPYLTPYLGPILDYPDGQKYAKRLSHEKQLLTELINQLPEMDAFEQRFYPGFENGLPFQWANYQQQVRYTYLLTDCMDTDAIFNDFRDNVRREIRKAEKQLSITESSDITALFDLKAASYAAKKEKLPIDKDYVRRLFDVVSWQKCGQVLEARDTHGKLHAAILLVWDYQSCYYLLGAADPENNTSGAMSLLLWQGIQLAGQQQLAFNFEGSMIPEIERFFSSFGGQLTPYYQFTKEKGGLLKVLKSLK